MASTEQALEVADQASAGTTGQGGEAGRASAGVALGACGHAYLVPDWVRVRCEDFGLLFYDTRSTRLTFVRSGDLLLPPAFTGSGRVLGVRAGLAAGSEEAPAGSEPGRAPLSRLLEDLVAKGLLVATGAA